jgi:hypothetical protein
MNVGILKTSCHENCTENVAAKFVLSQANELKQEHLEISQELFDHVNNDENLLKSIITRDKTWVYSYNVETKVQSSKWVSKKSPRSKNYTKIGQM